MITGRSFSKLIGYDSRRERERERGRYKKKMRGKNIETVGYVIEFEYGLQRNRLMKSMTPILE